MLWTLKKAWYRILQFFITRAEYLVRWRQPVLLEGPGAVKRLPAFVRSLGVKKLSLIHI